MKTKLEKDVRQMISVGESLACLCDCVMERLEESCNDAELAHSAEYRLVGSIVAAIDAAMERYENECEELDVY